MSALSIYPPFPTFAGKDGLPLEDGFIWIGSANLDPRTNPIQVYWDEALTQVAAQPIRTIGGYPSYSGTPARLFIGAAIYSILVQDKKGATVYSSLYNTGPSTFVNFSVSEEVQAAAAGQTVFTLANTYTPGTNSLTVFVDGVNQYDGVGYSFVETNGNTVTFNEGLHEGALVKFTTAIQLSGGVTDASQVAYTPPFTGSVTTNVEDKLAQTVSVKDFGAVGDGVTDDTAAIQAAHDASRVVEYPEPSAFYNITGTITLQPGSELISPERVEGNDTVSTIKYTGTAGAKMFACDAGNSAKGVVVQGVVLDGNSLAAIGLSLNTYRSNISAVTLKHFTDAAIDFPDSPVWAGENRIQGCMIYDCDIGVRGGTKSLDGFITDCIIYECNTACIDLDVDGGWFVSGNHFYGQCTHAIRVASTESGRYVDNLFDAHKDYAIKLTVGVVACSTLVSGNTFTNLTTGTRYGVHLTMNASAKVLVSDNTFYTSTATGYYAVLKAGGSTLFGKISENALVNMTSAAVSVDASTEYLQLTSGTLIAQVSRVNFQNSVSLVNGFGNPSASDGTGSIYSAYNTSDATAKGPLFVRYGGAWQKVPVLARWHTYAAAAPTTGEWTQGDVVWNTAPSAGGTPGWVCTTGGAAGTFVFKAMAAVAA